MFETILPEQHCLLKERCLIEHGIRKLERRSSITLGSIFRVVLGEHWGSALLWKEKIKGKNLILSRPQVIRLLSYFAVTH